MNRNDNGGYRRENRNRGRDWNNGNRRERDRERENDKERRRDHRFDLRHSQYAHSSHSSRESFEVEAALKSVKARFPVCEICGCKIEEIESAISNKGSESPVHFDCVLKHLKDTEKVGQNENISYIGQGRFAVLHFDNPHDLRHFKIVKIFEWENREKRGEWREEIAGVFSQVK